MKDLDVTNPFPSGSEEHLAYQRTYYFASARPRRDHKAMCGRVLGFMLKELPWDDGRLKMAHEINSCIDEKSLADLGEFYVNHFLRIFRSAKGLTPAPSIPPSCPSLDNDWVVNSNVITKVPQDYCTAKRQALKRDGNACILSGKLDATIRSELRKKIEAATIASLDAHDAELAAAAAPSAGFAKEYTKLNSIAQRATTILARFPGPPVVTNAAHIFSESINTDLNNNDKDYASSVWAVMERLGQRRFRDELDGPNIHRLSNIMTLDHHLHTHFSRLDLWLEADDAQLNTYRICSPDNPIIRDLPDTVTFISHNGNFDLPDPRYIKLHATCCRVAHLSGAASYMNDIMDDLDKGQTKVLSEDGSGSRILEFALLASRDL